MRLMEKECHYCGSSPANISKTAAGSIQYNGIDRVDNRSGYATGNVVACCHRCNTAKSNLSLSEFRDLIEKIFNRFNSKKG